jgi:hypothetical protein
MIPRLRALPIALPPVHHETLGFYLNRLADANRLKPATLAALLGPTRRWRRDEDDADGWTLETIDRLAILTGRPTGSLIHALPALADMHCAGRPRGRHRGPRRCMTHSTSYTSTPPNPAGNNTRPLNPMCERQG